jgi:DNA-binding LacI/PurR family transcriptional regulator
MGRPGTRVTLNDVAAASGVSRATASFVLRDSPGQSISAATRERVREAARALGYVPNGIARALREGTSRIVVLAIDPAMEGNYARSYIGGLDAELAAHEHVLLVRYSRGGAGGQDSRLANAISPRAVLRFGEPYLTGRELDDSGGGRRDGLAAHVAAQVGYLAARGHARVALALPSPDTPLRAVRQLFADQAAAAAGLPPLVPFVVPAGRAGSAAGAAGPAGTAPASSRTRAGDALHALLTADGGVTAVAAFDDDVALRVLAAMRSAGLSAPGDLAVIGFDDNGYGALFSPALTTVHIDAEAHGRQAARAILGLPAGDLSPVPGRVVIRESA